MPLTNEAKELAYYLANAWKSGVVEQYFELIDVTAGNAKTIQVAPGLGVLNEDEFKRPSMGVLMELGDYSGGELVRVSDSVTSTRGRKWKVQLGQKLRTVIDDIGTPIRFEDVPVNLDRKPSFFISYKSYEERFTKQLATYLRRVYGSDQVWFDEGIFAGQRWWNEILDQLNDRDILIYVVTREALESVYCRAEYTEAWRLGKQVISLLIRGAKPPSVLKQFQYVELSQGEITVDTLVEIFATVVQKKATLPLVLADGQWGTRVIQPVDPSGIKVNVKVDAGRDPGNTKDKIYCNTGVLLMVGDEIVIKASGHITVDSRQTWYDPNGIIVQSVNPDFISHVHPRGDTYKVVGYPKNIVDVGNIGVVGSLIAWIENDKSGLEQAFVIGTELSKTIVKGEEGFLHFAVNDTQGAYSDNEEFFDVSIEITHAE